MLELERGPDGNITSAEDAVWWSITTITTVGYGERYPVTTEGRLVAMGLMVVGVGLFGALSGAAASWFMHRRLTPALRGMARGARLTTPSSPEQSRTNARRRASEEFP